MSTEPTIREICEEFRRLDAEIPKAPWAVASNPEGQSQPAFPYVVDSTGRPDGEDIITQPLGSSDEVKAASAFIAYARNYTPALVAEVERLQRENDELKKSYRREQTIGDSKITDFVRPSLMGVTVYPEATVVLVEYGDNKTEVWEFPTDAALQKRVEELEEGGRRLQIIQDHGV